jgi:hypothetical protein
VPFGIAAVVATLSVSLIGGLINDVCAGCTRPFAMHIDVVDVDIQKYAGTAIAARAARLSGLPKVDLTSSVPHLGVAHLPARRHVPAGLLETERVCKEVKRGSSVLVQQVRRKDLHNTGEASGYFMEATRSTAPELRNVP